MNRNQQLRVACKWLLYFLSTHWVGRSYSLRMKEWDVGTWWLLPTPKRIVNGREVTFSFLNVPWYKRRTEDPEGDSWSKIVATTEYETPDFMLIRNKILLCKAIELFNLIPILRNHSLFSKDLLSILKN